MNPIVGIVLRLLTTYLFFLVLLRLSGKRTVSLGKLGSREQLSLGTPFDFVVALMISDIPDDMIFGDVPVAKAIVAVGTLVGLHLLVSYLSSRFPGFHRFVAGSPQAMIRQGKPVRETMQRERLSQSELEEELRLRRIEELGEVQQAMLEPTGTLSTERVEDAKPARRSDLNGRKG